MEPPGVYWLILQPEMCCIGDYFGIRWELAPPEGYWYRPARIKTNLDPKDVTTILSNHLLPIPPKQVQ